MRTGLDTIYQSEFRAYRPIKVINIQSDHWLINQSSRVEPTENGAIQYQSQCRDYRPIRAASWSDVNSTMWCDLEIHASLRVHLQAWRCMFCDERDVSCAGDAELIWGTGGCVAGCVEPKDRNRGVVVWLVDDSDCVDAAGYLSRKVGTKKWLCDLLAAVVLMLLVVLSRKVGTEEWLCDLLCHLCRA